MSIEDRVVHLSNLTSYLSYLEKLGGQIDPRLLAEFNEHHEALLSDLQAKQEKEEGNEH